MEMRCLTRFSRKQSLRQKNPCKLFTSLGSRSEGQEEGSREGR